MLSWPLWIARALAPYIAVLAGLVAMQSAWLAIVLYHVQIVAWNCRTWRHTIGGWDSNLARLLAPPCLLVGPVVYLALPFLLTHRDILDAWLVAHGLGGARLIAFAIYLGVLHPTLEQIHWNVLRSDKRYGGASHYAFAGYHALVLLPLLKTAGVLLSLVVLLLASMAWKHLSKRKGGLLLPAFTHTVADLGIIGAVVIYVIR